MLKRWAPWPRSVRWLGAIAVFVLALAIVWALSVPLADWLARHDVGSVTGSLHEEALDNARGRLLTLGAGLLAAGALIFTARNFTLSREGQVTDRYTKAIEQLGSEKLDVRIGGIYALERVARDSARDHPTVMEVLTAFIREHSREPWPPPDPGAQEQERSTRPDVQAALTVVGRRDAKRDIEQINLAGARLAGARLGPVIAPGPRLIRADFTRANLTSADLSRADLAFVNLTHANLGGATLTGASLTSAILTGAYLVRADLSRADLTQAHLSDANLTGAYLVRANLTDADLSRADLSRADLTDADLTSADLSRANLTDADLTGTGLTDTWLALARWPGNVQVPPGWKLDTNSGRLEVGTDSGPAETD